MSIAADNVVIIYRDKFMQLALSASSPIFRGYLADIDCRWPVISGSVDDRTDEERGKKVREKKLTIKLFAIATMA